MKFVVDTNVLLTFFWEKSFTKKILIDRRFEFVSPEYALEEINLHKSEILKKTRLSLDKFKELRENLAICVEFIPLEEYKEFLKKVKDIPDKEDADFIALALKLNLPIWSNDTHLREQSLSPTFTTGDMVRLFL